MAPTVLDSQWWLTQVYIVGIYAMSIFFFLFFLLLVSLQAAWSKLLWPHCLALYQSRTFECCRCDTGTRCHKCGHAFGVIKSAHTVAPVQLAYILAYCIYSGLCTHHPGTTYTLHGKSSCSMVLACPLGDLCFNLHCAWLACHMALYVTS